MAEREDFVRFFCCDREFYGENGLMRDRRYTKVINEFNSDTNQSFRKEKMKITRDSGHVLYLVYVLLFKNLKFLLITRPSRV